MRNRIFLKLMAAFALVVHRRRDEAVRVARETATWLNERGHEVRLPAEDADLVDVPECGVEPEKLASKSKNTPFAGRTLKGKVVHTMLRGRFTVREGSDADGQG